jgi:hypothetical protein
MVPKANDTNFYSPLARIGHYISLHDYNICIRHESPSGTL